MFVLLSTYEEIRDLYLELRRDHRELSQEHDALIAKWNDLVRQINAKGGTAILNKENKQLTKDEINLLIKLCHPDKHDGNKQANDITVKLLKLKND